MDLLTLTLEVAISKDDLMAYYATLHKTQIRFDCTKNHQRKIIETSSLDYLVFNTIVCNDFRTTLENGADRRSNGSPLFALPTDSTQHQLWSPVFAFPTEGYDIRQ